VVDREAEKHGKLLARNVGTAKPDIVKDGNYISVVNAHGAQRLGIALRSMLA
jgi:hypothetical protein